MQGKLFQRCTPLSYLSVLSLSGHVNTSRMAKLDMGSIFHIKNKWNILFIGNYYVNFQNYQNLMLLTSSDTKRTLMHLFLFTNSAQRELVSIGTQRIRNCNEQSLHYNLGHGTCYYAVFLLHKEKQEKKEMRVFSLFLVE